MGFYLTFNTKYNIMEINEFGQKKRNPHASSLLVRFGFAFLVNVHGISPWHIYLIVWRKDHTVAFRAAFQSRHGAVRGRLRALDSEESDRHRAVSVQAHHLADTADDLRVDAQPKAGAGAVLRALVLTSRNLLKKLASSRRLTSSYRSMLLRTSLLTRV